MEMKVYYDGVQMKVFESNKRLVVEYEDTGHNIILGPHCKGKDYTCSVDTKYMTFSIETSPYSTYIARLDLIEDTQEMVKVQEAMEEWIKG